MRLRALWMAVALHLDCKGDAPSNPMSPALCTQCDGFCGDPARADGGAVLKVDVPPPLANAPGPPSVVRAFAPTKVFQLIGDLDRQTQPPTRTPLQTETRFGLVGTDLGLPVLHKGRLYLVFGDAEPRLPFDPARRIPDADVIGFVDLPATAPEPLTSAGGLPLQFFLDDDGQYLAARLDGQMRLGGEVPYSGFSDGTNLYVNWLIDNPGRSVIGISKDDGRSFSSLVAVPTERMLFVAPMLVATSQVPGLGFTDAQTVLLWTRTRQQEGDPLFLAAAPLGTLADPRTWVYYAPGPAGPAWSPEVLDAPGIFTRSPGERCFGTLWIDFVPGLDKWMIVERCRTESDAAAETWPEYLSFRVGDQMLGPWSTPQPLFDRDADGALCHFQHKICDPTGADAGGLPGCCDSDYQPELYCKFGPSAGDLPEHPYGPSVLMPYSSFDAQTRTETLYFLASVNNPYSPMVMKGGLALR